jgi:acyl-CoA thioester hydrolase
MAGVTIRLPILWGDMDAFGHVNNVRYFTWFESARIAYFDRMGLEVDAGRGIGPILATTQADFLVPLAYPGEIDVTARVPRLGRTSFEMIYEVRVGGTLCARGTSVIVLIDYDSQEKVPLTQALRERISGIEDGVFSE